MRAMSISLPMCSVDFMDTTLSMEEQAIADYIQDLKKQYSIETTFEEIKELENKS